MSNESPTQSRRVIDKCGGVTALHEALQKIGCEVTRYGVIYWLRTGFIPAQRISDVLRAADYMDVSLSDEDFMDYPRKLAED